MELPTHMLNLSRSKKCKQINSFGGKGDYVCGLDDRYQKLHLSALVAIKGSFVDYGTMFIFEDTVTSGSFHGEGKQHILLMCDLQFFT